jgi:invasion protein IalB
VKKLFTIPLASLGSIESRHYGAAMSTFRFLAAAVLAASLLGTLPATAAQKAKPVPDKAKPKQEAQSGPQRLGESHGWTAYTYTEGGNKVCYVAGQPTKSEPANAPRKRVSALVTHRPSEKAVNVVSFIAGYPYKEKSEAEVDVDGKKYKLFTNSDTAWALDSKEDKEVVEAMEKGKQLTIKGSSSKGTATTDTYSLAGFKEAMALIDKSCNVKR